MKNLLTTKSSDILYKVSVRHYSGMSLVLWRYGREICCTYKVLQCGESTL